MRCVFCNRRADVIFNGYSVCAACVQLAVLVAGTGTEWFLAVSNRILAAQKEGR
jgi:hypothetical protein